MTDRKLALKFYFIRHGESEANSLNLLSNNPDSPYGLTVNGRRQTESAAAKIRGIEFTEFHTSPTPRALETASILKSHAGLPDYSVDLRLTEYGVGIYEGKGDPESWEKNNELWRDWFFHDKTESRFPGGESLNDLVGRFRGWLESVAGRHGSRDANILAVSHGGLLCAVLPFVLNNITVEYSFHHHISNASLVIAETSPDGIRCTTWSGERID